MYVIKKKTKPNFHCSPNRWGICQISRRLDYVHALASLPPTLLPTLILTQNQSLRTTALDHSSGRQGDGILDKHRRGVSRIARASLPGGGLMIAQRGIQ